MSEVALQSLLTIVCALILAVRAVIAIDRMSRLTCPQVAWAWLLFACCTLWLVFAIHTGELVGWAHTAFVVAVLAVMLSDRRRRPVRRLARRGERS